MIRRPFIIFGLTGAMLGLAGCSAQPSGPAVDIDSARERAQVVRICPDGTFIGFDPVTRRLIYVSAGVLVGSQGFISRGLTAEQVCPERRP